MEILQKLIEELAGKLEEDKQYAFIDILDQVLDYEDFELTEESVEDLYTMVSEEEEMSPEFIKKIIAMMNRPAEGEPEPLHKKFNNDPKTGHDDNDETDISDTKIPGVDGEGEELESFMKRLNAKAKEKIKDPQAMKESFDLSEDVEKIFEGEDFSDEIKSKANTVLEAIVKSRLSEEVELATEAILESVSELVESELFEYKEELSERLDTYLDHVVEAFVEEYEVEIASQLKVEVAESILAGVKNVLVENNIEIPEGKEDIFEEVLEEKDELNEMLSEEIEKNISLKKEVNSLKKEKLVSEMSEGLTEVEKEKFEKLCEGVDFHDSEDFVAKVKLLKETYYKAPKKAEDPKKVLGEEFNGEGEKEYISEDVLLSIEALNRLK